MNKKEFIVDQLTSTNFPYTVIADLTVKKYGGTCSKQYVAKIKKNEGLTRPGTEAKIKKLPVGYIPPHEKKKQENNLQQTLLDSGYEFAKDGFELVKAEDSTTKFDNLLEHIGHQDAVIEELEKKISKIHNLIYRIKHYTNKNIKQVTKKIYELSKL